MGASIECRVPFLDYRLVEMLAALPSAILFQGRRSKGLLRSAVGGRLPRSVLHHRKWGFGVPWKHYLRGLDGLRSLLFSLPNSPLILESPIERDALEQHIRAFLDGDDRSFPIIMQILMTVLAWQALDCGRAERFSHSTLANVSEPLCPT